MGGVERVVFGESEQATKEKSQRLTGKRPLAVEVDLYLYLFLYLYVCLYLYFNLYLYLYFHLYVYSVKHRKSAKLP